MGLPVGKVIATIGKVARAVGTIAGWLGGLFASRPNPAPLVNEPAPETQRSGTTSSSRRFD